MASKKAENIPQIDQVSPYAKPAEDVIVKYEKEESTGARSKKERTCIRKSKLKGTSDEIKAENLEGHKNFDNIEDILTFINGKEIENDSNQLEKVNRKRETESSLGAIRKTHLDKDKYSSMKNSKVKKDEKEKPDTTPTVEQLFEGLFSKNHDSVEQPTKIREFKDEQIASKSIVSKHLENISKNIYIDYGEGLKKRNDLDIEVTELTTCITAFEEVIEAELLELGENQCLSLETHHLVEIMGEAKKRMKVVEKQTKLNEEVFELNKTKIENIERSIDLHGKFMKDVEFMNFNEFEFMNLKETTMKNIEEINQIRNKMATCVKQIDQLEQEKESLNGVLTDVLKKRRLAKSESPRNDCLAMEIKPSKPHMEDAKPEPLRDPPSLPGESTYELSFHKTSLTTFKTSGKEDLSSILNNCELVVAATNWSILNWGINSPHPDCHKKLDEENLGRRRCSKDMCKKCTHNMKGCGLDLLNCERCELVTKSIAYHEEYKTIAQIVDQGGCGRPLKRRAEGLAKDAMRSFQNVLIPLLVSFINGETTYFLESQKDMTVEVRGADKLKDVWDRLLYVKFPLQRIKMDQDYLVVLQQQEDNLKEANLEYEDILDMARSYANSRMQMVELLDSAILPSFSAWFQKAEKDLDSWTKCAGEFENLANAVFTMIDSAKESSKTGVKVEVVDLKCMEEFLHSAISFTTAAKSSVTQKVPLEMMEKMDWAKELLTKIHCAQCRKAILVQGEDLVHLEKCSVCKAVRYCNATCQELQWKDHKDKCAQMKKMEKKRKRKEIRTGEKLIREKEKFWDQVLKPFLCRPGVTVETLEPFLYSNLHRNYNRSTTAEIYSMLVNQYNLEGSSMEQFPDPVECPCCPLGEDGHLVKMRTPREIYVHNQSEIHQKNEAPYLPA